MYFKKGKVKIPVALARGKHAHDQRETIKRREVDRDPHAAVRDGRR
jgi:SsrA-binding protein